MIKIYSLPTCSWCQKSKKYFDLNNLEYTDINIQEDDAAGDEMERISGQDSVPVIVINDKVIIGFDKAAIDEAIELNKNKSS
jgi:glutaredoxin-like YruB-family protein